jgi:Fe-S-cluster containining protein
MPVARLSLRVLGEPLVVEAEVPDGPVRLDEMLPFLRELDNRAIDQAVRRAEAAGASVSCRRGCSMCCRAQPVPVTPVEANALRRLVDSLPEPRRSEVRRRFDANVRRLKDAGLAEHFLTRDPNLTPEVAREIGIRYFRLGLVCPFLEDDACGIYADRPFVCRQYLVTSPAELCADPFVNPVQVIPMPLAPASATLRFAEAVLREPQFTVPLALSLEFAEARRESLEKQFDAKETFPKWIDAVLKPGPELAQS